MKRKWLTAPYIIWMLLFTIIPLAIVVYFAFTDSVTGAFTFGNIADIADYAAIFLRSRRWHRRCLRRGFLRI